MVHDQLLVVFEHSWYLQLKEHCKFKKRRQRKHAYMGSAIDRNYAIDRGYALDRDRLRTLDWSLQGFEAQRLINQKVSVGCMKFGKEECTLFCTKIVCVHLVNFNANRSQARQVKCKMGHQCPPSIWEFPGLESRSLHSCHLHNYIPQLICSSFHFSLSFTTSLLLFPLHPLPSIYPLQPSFISNHSLF